MEIIIKETKEITNTELNDCLNNVSEDIEESEESEIVESFIDYLNRIETGTVIDDFDVKMFKNISSYLKGVIKWQMTITYMDGNYLKLLA